MAKSNLSLLDPADFERVRNICKDTQMPPPAGGPPAKPILRKFNVTLPDYSSFPKQKLLIDSPKKRKIVKAGRRFGKTTSSVILAVIYFLNGKRVRYAAPVLDQTERFWALVKEALAETIEYGFFYKNETKHIIEPAGSTRQQIRAVTAWNPDTLRGDACDLLILEEFQLQDEKSWGEAGQPMLIDYNGDALLIFTPPSASSRSMSRANDKMHATKFFRNCINDDAWLCIHATSYENPFVPAEGLENVKRGMTRLALRQELLAEDVDEIPGALWSRKLIEETRVEAPPAGGYRRCVVGVDPSGSNTSDTETGIVAVGEGLDGHIYIFRDDSRPGTPQAWAGASVACYSETMADVIVGEQNFGGAMVEATIRAIDPNVSYKNVTASRSKVVRAQPVVALFEQGRAHIVGDLSQLEEQMVSYLPGDKSPDRMDACVWAVTELMGFGALGLIDYLKSDKAKELESRPLGAPPPQTVKVSSSSTLAAVTVNDNTPKCPACKSTLIQKVSGMERCGQCGTMWWPHGAPQILRQTRRDILLK